MTPPHIAKRYVVDTNVVVYAALPQAALAKRPDLIVAATASRWFMSRAVHHGAGMHAPHLMFSEARNVIYREGIAKGLFSEEDGLQIIISIQRDVGWTRHDPDDERTYAFQKMLQRTNSTGDSEFLAVAEALGCELITADGVLERAAQQHKLVVSVILVTAHPWSTPGALEDDPPID